jgi:hypothetical protein
MPYFKLPTNQNGIGNRFIEGGFAIPGSFTLANTWIFGGMIQYDFKRASQAYGEGSASVYLARTLLRNLSGLMAYDLNPYCGVAYRF